MNIIHLCLSLTLLGLGGVCANGGSVLTERGTGGKSEVNIFAIAFPVVAYVLESEKDAATTYLVACPKDTKTEACGFNQPYTLTQGPETVRWSYVASTDGTEQQLTLGCVLDGTTSMGCKATGVAGKGAKTTEAVTYTGDAAARLFRKVALVTDSASLLTYTAVSIAESIPTPTTTEKTVGTTQIFGTASITLQTPTHSYSSWSSTSQASTASASSASTPSPSTRSAAFTPSSEQAGNVVISPVEPSVPTSRLTVSTTETSIPPTPLSASEAGLGRQDGVGWVLLSVVTVMAILAIGS